MPRVSGLLCALGLALAACGGGDDDGAAPDAGRPDALVPDADTSPPTVFGGDRPAELVVPESYDPATPAPLVVALHGYFSSPDYIISYLRAAVMSADHGALFIAPDGLADPSGNHYWNASACCDLYDAGTDDVGYLTGLIHDIQAAYNVDPARIYVMGHSNGGFMALRLACEHPELIAAVISAAGAAPDTCTLSEPVSVLQVHGQVDQTISINGGVITQNDGTTKPYGSAAETVATFAAANGCDATTETGAPVDLTNADGAETVETRHTGCPTGVDAVLWSVAEADHVMLFSRNVPDLWGSFLSAHA